tara:strand:+ start:348 stop:515 length:168 start_codon:yes stop_codon:yes gene_type:complete
MSDLHFENERKLTDVIVKKIHDLKVDLFLFGGDCQCYRNKSLEPTLEGMKKFSTL